jgi:hypothetical protein
MKLTSANVEFEVVSAAASSAVCEIRAPGAELHPGDTAQLSAEDAQASQLVRAAGGGSHYAQTITFTEGDPVDEEVRDYTPRPKLPQVNRVRGRIGVEYGSIFGQGAGLGSNQASLVLRADMTRINGSYWNLSGYTRLRFTAVGTGQQQTLNDLMNRTYHLVLTYNNPQSKWVMGFGRFYLPWAPSLSTIDGGYVARRISRTVTAGVFAGTTPDPTSWNYSPNREMAGAFVNLQGGSYDGFHLLQRRGPRPLATELAPRARIRLPRKRLLPAAPFLGLPQHGDRRLASDHREAAGHRHRHRTQLPCCPLRSLEVAVAGCQSQLLPRFSHFRSAARRYRTAR